MTTTPCTGCAVQQGTHQPAEALHQIAEPAASVDKQIKDAIDALVMAAFTEGGCSEHRMLEARIQTELRKKELRTLLSTPQPCSRSHPHEEMTPMCELRTEIARLTNALARAEAQLAVAPQAVQPAIMPKGESAAAQLRAMATNYPAGHNWDKLDARACIRGALEIEALRALLAAAPAHPAEGVPTSSDLRERLARLEAGCNAHTTPTVYEAIADSKAALDELDEARQRVGISLAATQPAAQGRDLLAVIKAAAAKLDAAKRCHPNAVETLVDEALELLDGDREPAAQGLDAQALKQSFREYLSVSEHIDAGGHAMDSIATDLTRIVLAEEEVSAVIARRVHCNTSGQSGEDAENIRAAAQAKQGGAA